MNNEPFEIEYHTEELHCGNCGMVSSRSMSADGKPPREEGDIGICWNCAEIVVKIQGNNTLLPLKGGYLEILKERHPTLYENIEKTRQVLLEIKKEKKDNV